jgi:hypothetical protein
MRSLVSVRRRPLHLPPALLSEGPSDREGIHSFTTSLQWSAGTDLIFHDRDVIITACGRLWLHCKRINISTALAGQKLGTKEVDEGIWLVSFMHHDLGYFGPEQRTLQSLDNWFGVRSSPMS